MMLGYLVIVAVSVGAIMGDHCSVEDIHEVQNYWNEVWGRSFTNRRVQIAKAVFEELYKRQPSAKDVLASVEANNPDSPVYHAHLLRVVNGLDNVIQLFDDQKVLFAQLEHLAQQHGERAGVTVAHFKAVGEALRTVLAKVGGCYNDDAWKHCLKFLGKHITEKLH